MVLGRKSPSAWRSFKAFAMKGSVADMAVGMMIGDAFTGVVNSLVEDVFWVLFGTISLI